MTLTDGQSYCTESIKRDRGISLIVSIIVMIRAHEESATKGERMRAAWRNRAAKGGVFTTRGPKWLALENGRWVVLPEQAEIVQGIFTMYVGGAGATQIAKEPNLSGLPPIGRAIQVLDGQRGWHHPAKPFRLRPAASGAVQ